MNKKKLLGLITSLSLIGVTNWMGKAFAMEDEFSKRVEFQIEELVVEGVSLLKRLYGENLEIPKIKIDKNGNVFIVKSFWLIEGGKQKIGERYKINYKKLAFWLKKDLNIKIEEYFKRFNNVMFKSEKLKKDLALIKNLKKKKNKKNKNISLMSKVISQYVNQQMDNIKFQLEEKVEEAKIVAEEERQREKDKELEKKFKNEDY